MFTVVTCAAGACCECSVEKDRYDRILREGGRVGKAAKAC